jgi:hypothetical protein
LISFFILFLYVGLYFPFLFFIYFYVLLRLASAPVWLERLERLSSIS